MLDLLGLAITTVAPQSTNDPVETTQGEPGVVQGRVVWYYDPLRLSVFCDLGACQVSLCMLWARRLGARLRARVAGVGGQVRGRGGGVVLVAGVGGQVRGQVKARLRAEWEWMMKNTNGVDK